MKNWIRLSLLAVTCFAFNIAQADCNDNNGCGDCSSNNGCCTVDTNACCKGGNYTSKSVYVDLGFGESGTYLYESLFRNDRMNIAEDGYGGSFQAAIFGGKMSKNEEVARRFGLCHKRCMVVASGADSEEQAVGRDIDAAHFNIETESEFKSTICFCPSQKNIGVLLNYRQALGCYDDGAVRWWGEVNLPIVHQKNSMGLTETVDAAFDGGGAVDQVGLDDSPRVGNMIAAFKQTGMKYGRIDTSCCDLDKTQLANAELKIGYNSVMSECCHLDSYLGLAFKNSADRCAVNMFEPIAGQEHYALMWGSSLGFNVYNWEESSLRAHVALDARYWFENNELRSFDLKGKEWSRYMEMYASNEAATEANAGANAANAGTFGINLLTRCVDVTPGYQLNYNAALVYEGCAFNFEVGHTLYARQAEEICPNWKENPALKRAPGNGQTTIARTIGKQFNNEFITLANYSDAKIKQCDIDWNSGAHEAVLAHTLYAALGCNYDNWCYPTSFSIGGGYDFARGNSVIQRWTLFGKLGVSF